MNLLGKKFDNKVVLGKKLQFGKYLGNKILKNRKIIHQAFQPDEQDKKPISPLEKRSQ